MSEGGASWVLPTTHSDLDTKKAGVLCPGEELHQGVSARWGWGGHKPPSSSSWGRCRNQRLHQWSKAAPSLVGQRAAATARSLEGSPSPSLLDRLAPTALATRSHDTAARSRRGCPPPAGSSVSPEGSRQGPGGRVLAGAGDCSGQAASPVQGGGAPVPAVSSARCPLTSLTRCSRTELPGPAWHPWPCPCPTPTQEAKAGLRFSWL